MIDGACFEMIEDRIERFKILSEFFVRMEAYLANEPYHIICLRTLSTIILTDDKPYEGLTNKISQLSGVHRSTVCEFMKILRSCYSIKNKTTEQTIKITPKSGYKFKYTMSDKGFLEKELYDNVRLQMPWLQPMLTRMRSRWTYDNSVECLYRGSSQVFFLHHEITEIVKALKSLLNVELNKQFIKIISEGMRPYEIDYDLSKDKATFEERARRTLEAFFHCKFFLEMICKYGSLERKPTSADNGWSAILRLYDIHVEPIDCEKKPKSNEA